MDAETRFYIGLAVLMTYLRAALAGLDRALADQLLEISKSGGRLSALPGVISSPI
jgi:hypothetical protein